MPQHATNARDGKGFACAAIEPLISRTSGESPLSMPRCRALEIEKSVEKKRRAAFSFSGPAASETRENFALARRVRHRAAGLELRHRNIARHGKPLKEELHKSFVYSIDFSSCLFEVFHS